MGVRSTHYITADLAKEVLRSKIDKLSNDELESLLYDLKESAYKNYIVVNNADQIPVRKYPVDRIDTLEEFDEEYKQYNWEEDEDD